MKYTYRLGLILSALSVVFIACISGCGDGLPKRVPVSGRVLIDGQPLEHGTMGVAPVGQRSAYGTLGPGGKFSLTTFDDNDGTMPGKHPVMITYNDHIDTKSIKWFIPKKYSKYETSGLEIDVPGPRNDVEINLTWKDTEGGKPYIEKVK